MKASARASLRLSFVAAALLAAAPLASQQQVAPYTVVESGRSFTRLQDAVNAIGNGAGTIRFAAMRFADCAVQEAGDIAYVAEKPGEAVLEGVTCEGKAALVLRGRNARVQGLVFANITVPEKNGAGIRLEHGNLAIAQSWFRDSDQGVLSADDHASTVAIDKTTFTRLGTCEGAGGCAHSIYLGEYGTLTITDSRFEAGRGGHYVKSRAARIAVRNSSFDDSRGVATNYMIDLAAGSTGVIAGNWFVQGEDKENHSAFIAVAAEGKANTSSGLTIEGNDARFAPGVARESAFVADWSGDRLAIGSNALGSGLKRFERR